MPIHNEIGQVVVVYLIEIDNQHSIEFSNSSKLYPRNVLKRPAVFSAEERKIVLFMYINRKGRLTL